MAEVHEEYEAYLLQKASKLADRAAGPRLKVWSKAHALYKSMLEARSPLDWAAMAATADDGVARRMATNMGVIAEYLSEMRDNAKVEQLAKYILLRCEFSVNVTADQQLALQVFHMQTGRGTVRAVVF